LSEARSVNLISGIIIILIVPQPVAAWHNILVGNDLSGYVVKPLELVQKYFP